jgi:RimJ/RimL family protein N-acetyltransferase
MTRRTVMLPAARTDLPTLTALWCDTDARAPLQEAEVLTQARAEQWLDAGLAAARSGLGWWLVHPWSIGPALGCVGLLPGPAPSVPGEAVHAVAAFSREAWAQGYAHEALAALVEHAVHALCVPGLAMIGGPPGPLQEVQPHKPGLQPRLAAGASRARPRAHERANGG